MKGLDCIADGLRAHDLRQTDHLRVWHQVFWRCWHTSSQVTSAARKICPEFRFRLSQKTTPYTWRPWLSNITLLPIVQHDRLLLACLWVYCDAKLFFYYSSWKVVNQFWLHGSNSSTPHFFEWCQSMLDEVHVCSVIPNVPSLPLQLVMKGSEIR